MLLGLTLCIAIQPTSTVVATAASIISSLCALAGSQRPERQAEQTSAVELERRQARQSASDVAVPHSDEGSSGQTLPLQWWAQVMAVERELRQARQSGSDAAVPHSDEGRSEPQPSTTQPPETARHTLPLPQQQPSEQEEDAADAAGSSNSSLPMGATARHSASPRGSSTTKGSPPSRAELEVSNLSSCD